MTGCVCGIVCIENSSIFFFFLYALLINIFKNDCFKSFVYSLVSFEFELFFDFGV